MSRTAALAVFFMISLVLFSMPARTAEIDISDVKDAPAIIELLKDQLENLKNIKSYTYVLIKQERFRDGLHPEEIIKYEFKNPCRIYMKWIGNVDKGLTIIYNCEKSRKKFWAKEAGYLRSWGFIRLNLNSKFAKMYHPNHWLVNQSDIAFRSRMMLEQMEKAYKIGKLKIIPYGKVHDDETDTDTFRFDSIMPAGPGYGLKYYRTSIWIDARTLIPTKFYLYNFKNKLYERYVIKDLKLNADVPDKLFIVHHYRDIGDIDQ